MISKFRLWLAAFAVAATAAGGGLVLAVPAAAATLPVPIHKVNLHAAYLRTLPHAKYGLIKDKMAPRSAKVHVTPRTVLGKAGTCAEPNCDLSYQGGPVQHSPKVYLLLWGPNWSPTGSDTQYLNAFYSGLGASGDNWSTITSQYGDGSGYPSFGASVFAGAYQDTTTPVGTGTGGSIDPADLNAEADAFISSQGITDTADAQVVIASQSGTCFDDGWVGQPASCAYQPTQQYCAWHTNSLSGGETFTNLPYTLDAAASCGEDLINGSAGTYDGFSIVGGHEYAETITDPQPVSGWFDPSDNVSGGEIGDKCAWGGLLWGGSDPAGDVTLATGTFAMQSLWSNAAGACVMSASPQDTVTVTNPGSQTSTANTAVSLQIHATSSGGNTLSYAASSLPAGLTINSSTGLISGTPTTAGTSSVTVTATDTTGPSGSTTFSWTVKIVQATRTTLSLSATRVTYGHEQSERVSARVSARLGTPGGMVRIASAGKTACVIRLVSGAGSCTLPPTANRSGIAAITAYYLGQPQFRASTSATRTITVLKAATKTALSLSATTVTYGHEQAEKLTATVSPRYAGLPGGKVTVTAGKVTLCIITLAHGTGGCHLAAGKLKPGTYGLVARYPGSTDFTASASVKRTLTVRK